MVVARNMQATASYRLSQRHAEASGSSNSPYYHRCPGRMSITTGLPSPREKVLKLVEELVNLHVPNLRICVTSRPEATSSLSLIHLAFHSVSLHGENGQIPGHRRIYQIQVRTDS
jgi:hypothetical protein